MRERVFTTKRLWAGLWRAGDEPLAFALWGNPQVSRYITTGGAFTPRQIQDRLATELENQRRYGLQYRPLFLNGDGAFIGVCGMRPLPEDAAEIEFGFHLLPAHWGQGYGYEAARATLEYAFGPMGIARVYAGHHPENAASQKLLAKLGFVPAGRQLYRPTGRWHPIYCLRAGELPAPQPRG